MCQKHLALWLVPLTLLSLGSCRGPSQEDGIPLPHWEMQPLGPAVSIRGLSVVDAQVAWLGGSNSTLARTTDGGTTWAILPPPSPDTLDFRDVEAFDSLHAVVMSAGPGSKSRVYRTEDGGQSWQLTLANDAPAGFFNGIAFWDDQRGLLTGDPLDGRLFIAHTTDGGRSWMRIAPAVVPPVDSLEYGFAASGTHIAVAGDSLAWIGTGGGSARVFHTPDGGRSWSVAATPMIQGLASTGIFSLVFLNGKTGIAVGGDYARDTLAGNNLMSSDDGGRSWHLVEGPRLPYRSCIAAIDGILVAAGPTGTDLSFDRGLSWQPLGKTGFHVVSAGNGKEAVWAAGAEGKVARLQWE